MACAGHFGDMEVFREPFWQAMFDYRRVTLIGSNGYWDKRIFGGTYNVILNFFKCCHVRNERNAGFSKGMFSMIFMGTISENGKKITQHERITRSPSWMKKSGTGLSIWRNPNGWFIALFSNVVKTMPCLPPMTGNGKHTTFKNGDDWGMVVYFVRRNSSSVIKMAWWENFGTSSTYQRCIFHCHVEPEGIPCHGGWSCWQGSTKVLQNFSDNASFLLDHVREAKPLLPIDINYRYIRIIAFGCAHPTALLVHTQQHCRSIRTQHPRCSRCCERCWGTGPESDRFVGAGNGNPAGVVKLVCNWIKGWVVDLEEICCGHLWYRDVQGATVQRQTLWIY